MIRSRKKICLKEKSQFNQINKIIISFIAFNMITLTDWNHHNNQMLLLPVVFQQVITYQSLILFSNTYFSDVFFRLLFRAYFSNLFFESVIFELFFRLLFWTSFSNQSFSDLFIRLIFRTYFLDLFVGLILRTYFLDKFIFRTYLLFGLIFDLFGTYFSDCFCMKQITFQPIIWLGLMGWNCGWFKPVCGSTVKAEFDEEHFKKKNLIKRFKTQQKIT
jgi:hypothetical protein